MVKYKMVDFWGAFKDNFPPFQENIKKILKVFSGFIICFFIVIAFMRLFLLLKEYNYSEIIAYGEKVTILIGALAGLTFAYAATFEARESTERKAVRKIGRRFLNSFLYFVIGLILSIGFREVLSKPPDLSVFPGFLLRLFPESLVYSSIIATFILFLIGFVMLMVSAVYLGIGIYDLTINDYESKAKCS